MADWLDFANNAIQAAARTAQVAETGYYPPGTNVYAPTVYQQPPYQQAPYQQPYQYQQPQQPGAGFSFTANPTLWLLVAGVLVLIFSGKRH